MPWKIAPCWAAFSLQACPPECHLFYISFNRIIVHFYSILIFAENLYRFFLISWNFFLTFFINIRIFFFFFCRSLALLLFGCYWMILGSVVSDGMCFCYPEKLFHFYAVNKPTVKSILCFHFYSFMFTFLCSTEQKSWSCEQEVLLRQSGCCNLIKCQLSPDWIKGLVVMLLFHLSTNPVCDFQSWSKAADV